MNNLSISQVNKVKRLLSAVSTFATLLLVSVQAASGQSLLVASRGSNQGVLRFDGVTGAFVDTFVPNGVGGMNQPAGIEIGPDGALYVASNEMGAPNLTAVLRYDASTGAFLGQFGGLRTGSTSGITFGPNGNLFVANFDNHVIEEFDGDTGAFVRTFATQPSTSCCPQALAFGPNGNLFVTDQEAVEEYNGATGALVKIFATDVWAIGLAFAPDGSLLVLSRGPAPGPEVRKYDPATGALVGVLVPAGLLQVPATIKFGPDGRLYVTDSPAKQVLRFDWTTGALIDVFVPPGSGGLDAPVNLTFFQPPVSYTATIRPPVNQNGSSIFNLKRGVVPVKFTLTANGVSTCNLPPATIELVRTIGVVIGTVNESDFIHASDTGSNFRVEDCQYIYNLSTGGLGVGTYVVKIKISGVEVGSGAFSIK